jgi:hypothetical protein
MADEHTVNGAAAPSDAVRTAEDAQQAASRQR